MIVQDITNLSQLSGPPDVIVDVLAPNAGSLPIVSTNGIARVGTGTWGDQADIGSFDDLNLHFGPPSVAKHDLATALYVDLLMGNTKLKGKRVTDGTDVAAQCVLMDNGSSEIIVNSSPATATFVLAGAPATGDEGIISFYNNGVIVGQAASYTALAGGTLQNFVDGLVAAIATDRTNNGALSTGIAAATDQGGTTLSLSTNGAPATGAAWTAQLEIKSAVVTCTNENIVQTITPGSDLVYGAVLTQPGQPTHTVTEPPAPWLLLTAASTGSRLNPSSGRSAQVLVAAGSDSTAAKPTVKLVFVVPGISTPEVYDRIPAWKLVAGAPVFDGLTQQTQAIAAVNGQPYGVNNQFQAPRPSRWWLASVPATQNTPIGQADYYTATPIDANGSLGTDGATAITTADMLGSGASNPGTGMYAFDGQISGYKLTLVGCDDVATAGSLLLAFGKAQNAQTAIAFPNGTDSDTAIDDKQTYGLQDYTMSVWAGDWCEFNDTTNGGLIRYLSPADIASSQMALTPPQRSPMNLNIPVVLGTNRTGTQQNVPYPTSEIDDLEAAGINLITMGGISGEDFPMIRTNVNSMNNDPDRGLLSYSSMIQYLAVEFDSNLLAGLIGQTQSTQPGDKQRANARAIFNGFLGGLEKDEIIDTYSVQCDLRNNDPTNSIPRGYFRVDCIVEFMSVIDKVVIGLVGGQTVLAIQPQQVSPATS